MVRIFTILTALAVMLIILVGGGIYWFSTAQIEKARENARSSLSKGVAYNISGQVKILSEMLDQMAENPELINAVYKGNQPAMRALASEMQNYLPGAMRVRVLIPDSATVDQVNIPHMGFADLDLVKETEKKHQLAVIQGTGEHRHLAIARQILRNDRVIGVILASLKYDFIKKIINTAGINEGLLVLKQGKVSLHAMGNQELKGNSSAEEITIPGTRWNFQFWDSDSVGMGGTSIIAATIMVPVFLTILAFLFGFRRITEMLREDQSSVVKVVKDLMTNKPLGNYPVSLNEMRAIISTLVQFKRVLEHEGSTLEDDENEMGLSGFFDESSTDDEPEGMGFLRANEGIEVSDSDHEQAADLSKETSIDFGNQQANELLNSTESLPEQNNNNIFRAYDIRGEYGQSLTKEIVFDIGRAIGSEAKEINCNTVVVGRDGRTSSPGLADALAKGIIATGLNVLDLGLVPTPVLYFVTHHSEGRCGVMVTGSHNPAEYNGLKVVIEGHALYGESLLKLKQRIDSNDFTNGPEGHIDQNNMFINEYIGMISDDIHIERPMKVVLDCGNGVAGELGPTLLKTLGCEIVELFCNIDGNFPNHHPDPSKPENLEDLITAVKENNADVGIAFDGDGDRLGIVDDKGNIIWPDRQMMLFAKNVLERKPGAEIIYDVKCSHHLEDQILKFGGRPIMWKSGHSLMKAKIKETGAKLAGEMSGHIYFNDRWFGFDDGLYSAARMIEILATDNRASNEVFKELPDSINTPELLIPVADGEKFAVIEKLLAISNFTDAKVIDIDGMRVNFNDGWGLVRASNTTPSLVVRFEADSQDVLSRIQAQFKKLLLKVNPDLMLPF